MSFLSKLFGRPAPAAANDASLVAAALTAAARDTNVRDGMMNVLTRMGTPQDKRRAGIYTTPIQLDDQQCDAMYEGSWLAGKIIDIPVDDMTRMGWTRKFDGSDKGDALKKIEEAEKNFLLLDRVPRSAKWGRLYGGSTLVPVIRGQRLDEPLILDSVKMGMLQNFLELDRYDITPSTTLDENPESPNAGYPVSYRWNQKGLDIHWSRVIKFGGRELPYRIKKQRQFWDASILQRIAEVISNYDQAEGGVASLILEAKIDVLMMQNLAVTLAEEGGEAKVQKRIEIALLAKSIWQTLVMDAGEGGDGKGGDKFDHKQLSFANLDKILDRLGQSVAGAGDVPMTRLFGISPGGQNATGESDDDNYDDHVAALRRTKLAPQLRQIDQVLIRSTLGKMPENYELDFPPLTQTDPHEAAEIEKLEAEAWHILLEDGIYTPNLIAREVMARKRMRAMEQADVDLTSDEIPETDPMPEPLPGGDPNADPAVDPANRDAA